MGHWEETQLREAILVDQRDIPDHMTLCSVYKVGKKEEWGIFGMMVFPKSPLQMIGPCSPGDGHLPHHGK